MQLSGTSYKGPLALALLSTPIMHRGRHPQSESRTPYFWRKNPSGQCRCWKSPEDSTSPVNASCCMSRAIGTIAGAESRIERAERGNGCSSNSMRWSPIYRRGLLLASLVNGARDLQPTRGDGMSALCRAAGDGKPPQVPSYFCAGQLTCVDNRAVRYKQHPCRPTAATTSSFDLPGDPCLGAAPDRANPLLSWPLTGDLTLRSNYPAIVPRWGHRVFRAKR